MVENTEDISGSATFHSFSQAIGFPDQTPAHIRFATFVDTIVARESDRRGIPSENLVRHSPENGIPEFQDYATLSAAVVALEEELPKDDFYYEWFALLFNRLFEVRDKIPLFDISLYTRRVLFYLIPGFFEGISAQVLFKTFRTGLNRMRVFELVEAIVSKDARARQIRNNVDEHRAMCADLLQAEELAKDFVLEMRRIPRERLILAEEKGRHALRIQNAANVLWDNLVSHGVHWNLTICGHILKVFEEAVDRLQQCGVLASYSVMIRLDELCTLLRKPLEKDREDQLQS